MKHRSKRFLSILLSLVLVLGLLPGMSLAAYAGYTTLKNNKTVVTFNNYNWYIIEDNSTAANAGTVTLLAADTSFGTLPFNVYYDWSYNNSGLDIAKGVKYYLDSIVAGTAGEGKPNFKDVADAIQPVTLTTYKYNSTEVFETTPNAKLWLLSTSEAGPYVSFNFTGADDGAWWLRSPGDNDSCVACVGTCYDNAARHVHAEGYGSQNNYGVRPALKLDLSKVTYNSTSKTFTVASFSVAITAGSNMTKAGGSGAASQTILSGAMTPVVYTAANGYYFPTNYSVAAVNGISVTRNSYTQITVSGTPTANAAITLTAPTAKGNQNPPETTGLIVTNATNATSADGSISGVTTAMEYSVNNGASWTAVTGTTITGLNPGSVQIRLKGDDTHNASAAVSKTVGNAALISAKTTATNTVNAVNAADYIAADQQTVTNAKTTAIAAINAATTTAAVETALTNFNNAISGCTTKADADLITQVMSEVSVKTDSMTYTGSPFQLIDTPTTALPAGYTMKYAVTTENAAPADNSYTTSNYTATNAGTYYVWYKVVGDANHNYTTSGSGTATIAPKSGDTFTAAQIAGETLTYDGTDKAPTLTVKDGDTDITTYAVKYEGVAPTQYAESQTAPTDPGSYKAVIELSGNYSGTKEAAFTIAPATLTNVSVTQNGTLTYTGEALTPQVTTAATAANNQTVTFTYSKTQDGTYGAMPTVTNVSDGGTIYYKASAPNHNNAAGSFTVTVDKASQAAPAAPTKASATINSITLTATDGYQYKCGDGDWQDSAVFTGLTMNTEYTFYQRLKETANYNASPSSSAKIKTNNHAHEWSYTAGTGENANTITATCANTDSGHTGSPTATLTIVAPTLTVYGGTGDAAATINGSIDGVDNPAIVYKQDSATLDTAPTDAGDYRAEITLGSGGNAATAYVTYTIAKAALTVTAKPKTITYGDAPANDGVEYSSFVNNETATVLSGELTYTYNYEQYGNVGSYTITPSGLTSGNYAITFEPGTLTVEQKEVGLTWANQSFNYDSQSHKPDATAIYLVNNDVILVTVTGEQANANSGATTYTATASALTGEKASNYKLPTANTATFTIAKVPLTITANAKTITYGDAPSNNGVEYAGFVGEETSDVLGGTLAYDYSYAQYGDVGNAYTITPSGLTSGNYAITFEPGTLTVNQKEVGLNWSNLSFTYDGQSHKPTAAATGNVNNDVIGVTVSGAQTDAGESHTATASALTGDKAGNYKLPVANTQSFTIGKTTISGAIVSMKTYAYDDTISSPVIVSDSKEGSNGALVGSDTTMQVTYYYQATAFLKSQTDDISTLGSTEGVYTTPTTFDVGTHYVLAVITGDNYSNVPYVTQSAFEVKQNTEKERTAPTAPAVDGTTVTVAEVDRGKTLEYSLGGETWMSVTMDDNGTFKAEWQSPVENQNVLLREAADENYEKPSQSVESNGTVTTTTYTVTYDANGGVNAPAAVTTTKDKTVTVSARRSMTRTGYTFTGWNTKKDGGGEPYAAGSTVNTGMTLYAQWTENTYTVKFSANGGTGTMEELKDIPYIEATKLPENDFTRTGYNFVGWSTSSSGNAMYRDKQTVKSLAESGTVTLYAVWAKDLYSLSGTVYEYEDDSVTPVPGAKVKLTLGNTVIETVTTDADGTYNFNAAPALYNIVATKDDVTKTELANLTENKAIDLIMPTSKTSSLLEVRGSNTPAVVVGGLEEVAAAEEIEERSIVVTMTATAQSESENADAEEIGKAAAGSAGILLLDITVEKKISNNGDVESKEPITETSTVIEIVIPYDFSGKNSVKVYRRHGDEDAKALVQNDTGADGTYRLDRTNGRIYIYASKFSTYAIGYTVSSAGGGGGVATTITATVTGDANTVPVTSTISGTTATVKALTDEQLSKVIGDKIGDKDSGASTKTEPVVIDVSGLGKDIATATIPTATVKAIAEAVADSKKTTDGLTVKLTDGSLTFDAAALAAIVEQAKGSDIKFNFDNIGENKLNTKQKATTKEMDVQAVYDAYITSNGVRISDFKGGKVTVTVTYTLKADQKGGGVVVWHVADDGGKTEIPTSYDAKEVTFNVTHFSNYVVAYDAERAANSVLNCPKDGTCPMARFPDLKLHEWYHDGIHWALESGIMKGYDNGSFGPGDSTTRAQVVTMLWRLEGSPAYVGMSEFSDVDNEEWYGPAVRWANAEGIVNGYDDGRFGPNDAVTREQLVAILYRYAQYKGLDVSVGEDTNILSYDDAFDVSSWAMSAMQWAVGSGVVNGLEKNGVLVLAPFDSSTRAVVATMFWRFGK